MGFVSLKSRRARGVAQAEASAALKRQLVEALDLGPEDALAVNDIACADPDCPDLETIVLVMRVGQPTRAVRIRRAIAAVEVVEVSELAAEERRLRDEAAGNDRAPAHFSAVP